MGALPPHRFRSRGSISVFASAVSGPDLGFESAISGLRARFGVFEHDFGVESAISGFRGRISGGETGPRQTMRHPTHAHPLATISGPDFGFEGAISGLRARFRGFGAGFGG
eukprot:424336-Rhodomonas_salina.1